MTINRIIFSLMGLSLIAACSSIDANRMAYQSLRQADCMQNRSIERDRQYFCHGSDDAEYRAYKEERAAYLGYEDQ